MTAPANTPRRIVLRSHDWRCASEQTTVPANPGRPIGYERSLRLPADCLMVRELCGSDGDWVQRGNELHTDMIGPWLIRYTRDTDDLPDTLRKAVVARDLAELLDTPAAWAVYREALSAAKEADAQMQEAAA